MKRKNYKVFSLGTRTLSVLMLCGAICVGSVSASSAATPSGETAMQQKNINVTFQVFEEDGTTPVIGAAVVLVGNNAKSSLTDVNGTAVINGIPENGAVKITYVGMVPQEVQLNGRTNIKVVMKVDATNIEEVVVVGFGTQKKVNLTGAVSVVKSDALENRPVQNVSQALQGMVPGLSMGVNSSGGELNNSMTMNIRGSGTIGSGSSGGVLVLIDGMEGNMNSLNPQDVESISVLKDAAASSIYGSRAPFGVLLITTKKGKSGKITVNYNNNFRWTDPLLTPQMLNSEDFAEYFNLAAKESGQGAVFSPYVMGKIRDYRAGKITEQTEANSNRTGWQNYTGSWGDNDWFGIQYKDWAFSHEHNLSLSGGSDKVQFFLSGNLMEQNGLLRFSGDTYGRQTFSAKINAELAPWANITSNTKLIRELYDRAAYQTGLFYHNIARRWPTLPLTYPKDVEWDNPNYGDNNEIEQLRSGGRDKNEKDFIYQQLALVLEPVKGWRINIEGNLRQTTNYNQWEVLPGYMMDPGGKIRFIDFDGGGSDYTPGLTRVNASSSKENFYNTNIYTDYTLELESGHNFKIMAGVQNELAQTRNLSAQGDNLITPGTPTVSNTTTDPRSSGSYGHWATMGIFGRFNYTYKDRYLFEANVRYDGSSRFAPDKRWNIFPSFSAGWNISNEAFMENSKNWLSLLKIRGSWGQLGNQNLDNWAPYYQSLPVSKNYNWLINGVKPGIYASAPGLISSLMTWETIESWNVGLDASFFDSRLSMVFDVYERTTKNMIGPAPTLPGVLGAGVPKQNNADMVNRGWELELSWRDRIESAGISYGVRFNISDNVATVTRYPNPTMAVGDWYAGRLSGEIWGYTTIGIAQTQAEMDAHTSKINQNALGTKWQAGDIMYADIDGDGKIDGGQGTLGKTGDRSIIGNSTPRYSYGLNFDIAWKGIDFSFFLQGVGKRDYMPGGPYMWGADGGMWQSAGFETHLDFWRSADSQNTDPNAANYNYFGANPDGYFPRLSWDTSKNKQTQTRYLQDASYIRLKNVQLGYTLPEHITQKFGCRKLRFYVSGENLLTFTNLISTFDPETISGGWGDGKVYPLSKVISGGLSITF